MRSGAMRDEIDGCLQKAMEGFRSEEVLRDGYYALTAANARIPSAILDISASGRSFRGRLMEIYEEIRRQEAGWLNEGTGIIKTVL